MTSLFQRLARPGFAVIAAAWIAALTAASAPAAAAQASASTAPPASLLPAVAASQTFAVATKVETPFHGGPPGGGPPGGGSGQGGPPGGPPPGGAGSSGGVPPSFPIDESGTLTLSRTTNTSMHVTTSGDLDTLDAAFVVDAGGAVSPSSPPNKYVVAFDNANAIVTKQTASPKPGDTWDASAQIQTFGGPQTTVPLSVKVVSVSDGLLTLAATGIASITISTPRGDRPADLAINIDMQVASGTLRSYTQSLAQTVKTPRRTFTLDATTTLTSK